MCWRTTARAVHAAEDPPRRRSLRAQVPYHWIATSENAPHINFIVGTRRPAPRSSSTNIIEFLKEQQNFTNLGVTTLKSVPRIGPLRTGKKQVRMVDFEYDNQPVAFKRF